MTTSLRTAITTWFAGLASLVIGFGSIALYVGVRWSLLEGLDAKLEAQAHGVAALCEWEDGRVHLEGYYELAGHAPLLERDYGFEVRLAPNGDVQVRKGLALPPLPPNPNTGGQTYGNLRVMTVSIQFPARPSETPPHAEPESPGFTIQVRTASSLDSLERQLTTIRWLAAAVAGASVVSVVAFGLFFSRRVIRPLSLLGEVAARVRAGKVEPMPRSGSGDEIDRLAALFEQAFAAVRGSVDQQKRFVADASHELRNPLAILSSVAEIGLRRERTPTEYQDLLGKIEDVAGRMGRMLDALLTLARLDAQGRMPGQPVELATISKRVVEESEPGVRIVLEATDSVVIGDEDLLVMLLRNLVDNAAKHATSQVYVSIRRHGAFAVIRVSDDGPGLPPAERTHAFDRFFRGRNSKGQGAGLGLALVLSIAKAHGGDCRIDESAAGLAVSVQLPLS